MNEKFYDWIEDYILGKLASPKLEEFESALASDTTLATAVQQHRTEWEAQELLAEKLLREQIRQTFLESPPPPQSWFSKNWKWSLPALLLLVCAGVFFFLKPPTATNVLPENVPPSSVPKNNQVVPTPPQEPIADQSQKSKPRQLAMLAYRVPEGLSGIRGEETDDTLSLASKAFEQKNYRRVLEMLASLPEDNRQEALSLRAHTQFGAGKYAAAAKDFADLEAGGIYRREAQWFGLLARMAMPNADKNMWMKQLEAIRKQPKHPYQKEAEALGEKLVQI